MIIAGMGTQEKTDFTEQYDLTEELKKALRMMEIIRERFWKLRLVPEVHQSSTVRLS